MTFRTEWFTLDLAEDWIAQETGDPERFNYFSAARSAQVVVSLMGFDAHGRPVLDLAGRLLEIRQRAEVDLAAEEGLTVEFDEPWLKPSPDGSTVQINYVGHDSGGTWFFSSGFVHAGGLLNIRGELLNSDRAATDALFSHVLSNLTL